MRSIESPLFEARVLEQSSDEKTITFAGFQGAAVINTQSGMILSHIKMSDILGPEFDECDNFGCGINRAGFVGTDVSADRRLVALAMRSGPIFVVDAQSKKIHFKIETNLPTGKRLMIRTIKIDPLGRSIFVYGTEDHAKPSPGHVLKFSLTDGSLLNWYAGPEALGECGGPVGNSIFSSDFRYVYSSDSGNGVQMNMIQPALLRIYQLNEND